MLDHLVAFARDAGFGRISLETGTMAAFTPARSLYTKRGFVPCQPFGEYWESPNSTFMTLVLDD
jgi:putative acetyltransferase